MRYRFGVVGLGRVGLAMLTLLRDAGHTPVWAVSSKDIDFGVDIYRTIPPDPSGAQLVLLAVPDGRISQVARETALRWADGCRGVAFVHFSGLLTSAELHALAAQGGLTGSLHPLQSIVDAEQARDAMKESVFTFEGAGGARDVAVDVASSLGVPLVDIDPAHKALYHASAVVASNYLVALMHQAGEIAQCAGMNLAHLMGLVQGTVSNIRRLGSAALTGPVARGDWDTVRAHVEALEIACPDILPSYLELARYTSRIAGVPFPGGLGSDPCPIDPDELLRRVTVLRSRGLKVVFTNGCFDILHAGHVAYLTEARSLGDCLVVGLNSDDSVRRLKGPGRPVNTVGARAKVLGALRCVDFVVVFGEDTPLGLIERIRPDVLVKGGDWEGREIVGADVVERSGGRVVTVPFEEGFSTTSIIRRIRRT